MHQYQSRQQCKGLFSIFFWNHMSSVKYRKQEQILKILDTMNRRSQFYNVLKYQQQGTTPRLATRATTSWILPRCVVQLQTNLARRSKILGFLRAKLQSQPKVSGHPQKKALPRFPSFNVAPMMSTFPSIFFSNLQNNIGQGVGGKRKPLSNVIVGDWSQPKVSGHPQKKALPRFPSFNVAPMMSTFPSIFFRTCKTTLGRGYGGKGSHCPMLLSEIVGTFYEGFASLPIVEAWW